MNETGYGNWHVNIIPKGCDS